MSEDQYIRLAFCMIALTLVVVGMGSYICFKLLEFERKLCVSIKFVGDECNVKIGIEQDQS